MYTFFTILLTFFLYGYYIISKTNDKDNLTFKEIAEMIFGDYPSIEGKWYYKLGWAVIKILSYLLILAGIIGVIYIMFTYLP